MWTTYYESISNSESKKYKFHAVNQYFKKNDGQSRNVLTYWVGQN
jgi:hypothetical protein